MQTIKDFPITLTATDVSNILGCSKRIAYEVMERKDFPLIRVGRLKRVNRDAFFKWMESQQGEVM